MQGTEIHCQQLRKGGQWGFVKGILWKRRDGGKSARANQKAAGSEVSRLSLRWLSGTSLRHREPTSLPSQGLPTIWLDQDLGTTRTPSPYDWTSLVPPFKFAASETLMLGQNVSAIDQPDNAA